MIASRLQSAARAVLCIAALAGRAWALDVVVFKTGGELRGEVVGTRDGTLQLNLLPGAISLRADDIKEIKKEDKPGWYLDRIRGRDALTVVEILDSALRSGCSSNAIVAKYVEACVEAAETLVAEGRPARAAELCRRALALRPDEAETAELLKRAEAGESRLHAELRALRLELDGRPGNDYARFMLAETYRKLGREREALAEYMKITEGKVSFDGGVEQIELLRAFIRANLRIEEPAANAGGPATGKRQNIELPGFIVYLCDENLARELPRRLPAIRERVAADLGFQPPDSCTIRVLRDRQEFAAKTGNKFGDGYSSSNCIWTYHGASAILDNVIPHELAHVILRQATGGMPLWLDEGLAIRQETGAGAYWDLLRSGKRLALAKLLACTASPESAEENDLFYASAYSFTDMLIKDGGMKKVRRLAELLKVAPPDQAFRQVYETQSLRELEDRWALYLQD